MAVTETAFTDQTLMELWNQSDQDSERLLKKALLEGLDIALKKDSVFFSKLSKGPQVSNPLVRWMEERDYPDAVSCQLGTTTMTFTDGTIFGDAVSADNIKQVIRIGTILERRSDGVQAIVTDNSGLASTPFTATVAAYGNTTLSDDSAYVTWDVVSEVWYDRRDVDDTRSLARTFRKCGTQTFLESFEILHMRENTKYEQVGDEKEHQLAALLRKLKKSLAKACIRSRPYYSSGYKYGDEYEKPTMVGLHVIPEIENATEALTNTYVNLSSGTLTKDHIDDLVYDMELDENTDFNTGDWAIFCHPLIHKFIHDFDISYRRKTNDDKSVGFHVELFDSKQGKTFPIYSESNFRPDVLQVVNMDSLKYGYYAGDTPWRKEIATKGRYKQWAITFSAYGLVHRKPRQSIGTLYGIATS